MGPMGPQALGSGWAFLAGADFFTNFLVFDEKLGFLEPRGHLLATCWPLVSHLWVDFLDYPDFWQLARLKITLPYKLHNVPLFASPAALDASDGRLKLQHGTTMAAPNYKDCTGPHRCNGCIRLQRQYLEA